MAFPICFEWTCHYHTTLSSSHILKSKWLSKWGERVREKERGRENESGREREWVRAQGPGVISLSQPPSRTNTLGLCEQWRHAQASLSFSLSLALSFPLLISFCLYPALYSLNDEREDDREKESSWARERPGMSVHSVVVKHMRAHKSLLFLRGGVCVSVCVLAKYRCSGWVCSGWKEWEVKKIKREGEIKGEIMSVDNQTVYVPQVLGSGVPHHKKDQSENNTAPSPTPP